MSKYALCLLTAFLCCGALLHAAEDWAQHTSQNYGYILQYPSDWEFRSDPETGFLELIMQSEVSSLPSVFNLEVQPLSDYDRHLDFMDYMQNGLEAVTSELARQGHINIKVLASEADTLSGLAAHRIILNSNHYSNLTLRSTLIRIRQKDRHFLLKCSGEERAGFTLAEPAFERIIGSFGFQSLGSSYLDDYVRVRADLSGAETVFHWKGAVYSFIPGDKRKELFAVEGYNIVRAVPKENGYNLLGKEVAFFLDHRTNQVLDNWRNLITGRDVPVLHVFNDPVNQDLSFNEETMSLLPMILPSMDLGDKLAFYTETFPYYPNPLPRREFPLSSHSDIYQAAEFVQYMAERSDLADPELSSVPATYSFTRIYPWLPFMQMANSTGNVIWVCRGRKLEGGFADLPEYVREHVLAENPEFATAPDAWSEPNETIWTHFRKLSEQDITAP
ncbi:MAG: DUF1838 domain-containing protein [Candidatus Syntrophosphaera sp.]|nr:DUF1838 domain-containing protein [Candidatus Syntrophosphaera sp.]